MNHSNNNQQLRLLSKGIENESFIGSICILPVFN